MNQLDGGREIADRQRTARVLARATESELSTAWDGWGEDRPRIEFLRGPEAGLVMVQGRTGGTGDRFNLGEATVTRATVLARDTDATETTGTAYVLGSNPQRAGLAAIFDALLGSSHRDRVLAEVIEPLQRVQDEQDALADAQARSTVVDFFTVARENAGPDEDE